MNASQVVYFCELNSMVFIRVWFISVVFYHRHAMKDAIHDYNPSKQSQYYLYIVKKAYNMHFYLTMALHYIVCFNYMLVLFNAVQKIKRKLKPTKQLQWRLQMDLESCFCLTHAFKYYMYDFSYVYTHNLHKWFDVYHNNTQRTWNLIALSQDCSVSFVY